MICSIFKMNSLNERSLFFGHHRIDLENLRISKRRSA